MRNFGVFVIVSLTVALVAGVLFFSFAPSDNVAMAVPDVATGAVAGAVAEQAVAPEIAQSYAVRAAALQAQIDQLQVAMDERLLTYAEQRTVLENAQLASDEQVAALTQQEQLLRRQLDEAAGLRTTRDAQLTQQLQQVQAQYATRAGEITAQINEAQARLAEGNQLLGR